MEQRGLDDDHHNIRTAKGTNQNCPFSSRTLCTSYYSCQTACSEWSTQNFNQDRSLLPISIWIRFTLFSDWNSPRLRCHSSLASAYSPEETSWVSECYYSIQASLAQNWHCRLNFSWFLETDHSSRFRLDSVKSAWLFVTRPRDPTKCRPRSRKWHLFDTTGGKSFNVSSIEDCACLWQGLLQVNMSLANRFCFS